MVLKCAVSRKSLKNGLFEVDGRVFYANLTPIFEAGRIRDPRGAGAGIFLIGKCVLCVCCCVRLAEDTLTDQKNPGANFQR